MKTVCVITGGGSGMGFATAKVLGKEHVIVISGRTQARLDEAVAELTAMGIEAKAVVCDVANRATVVNLANIAKDFGPIAAVIHAAAISPHMGTPENIMQVNALGTIHIHEVFFEVMDAGSCLIDVASMGGYITPALLLPTRSYRYCRGNLDKFMKKMIARTKILPAGLRSGLAYGISKNFVIWYARLEAARFGVKGIRVLSVSPGSFETEMGEMEREGAEKYIQYCAIKRFGHVEEVAQLLAFCADKRLGYLTGVDIICDGGCLAEYRQSPLSLLALTHKQ